MGRLAQADARVRNLAAFASSKFTRKRTPRRELACAFVLGVSGYRRRFEVRAQPQVQPEVRAQVEARARNFLPDIRGLFAKNDRIVSLAILALGIYAEEGPKNGRF